MKARKFVWGKLNEQKKWIKKAKKKQKKLVHSLNYNSDRVYQVLAFYNE